MEEVKQAVNTTESAPVEQQVVNQPEPDQQATQETQETKTAPVADSNQQLEAVDEYGVPYKNRFFEQKRKYEETIEKLPSLVEDAVSKSFQSHGQTAQPDPTISQLEQYALEHPEQRPYVEEKKAELIRKQLAREVEEKFTSREKAREVDIKKQQSLAYVQATFPDAFVKNQQGQIVDWNRQSPLTQHIFNIMQDPRLSKGENGDELALAAEIASARVMRQQQPVIQQKLQQQKAEIGNLQRQTMVEGGQRSNVQPVPEYRQAIDRAKQSGNVRDVAEALKAIAKAKAASRG